MRFRSAFPFLLATGALFGQNLSPREIFYGQRRAPEVKPAAAPTRPGKITPARTPDVARTPKATPQMPSSTATSTPAETPVETAVESPRNHPAVLTGGAEVIPVKLLKGSSPLALRYSVKKTDGNGNSVEVDPDEVFHEGDQITLAIEANDAGYLYVVHQGSSGRWDVKYPSSKVAGSNRVEQNHAYRVPAPVDEVFAFDSTPGNERLFVILTRKPAKDLDDLIFSLQDKPKAAEKSPVMMAQNMSPIDDSTVSQMRRVYSRDLVIQKVTENKQSDQSQGVPPERVGEKAVYVVNAKAGPDARVVADISLRHQ